MHCMYFNGRNVIHNLPFSFQKSTENIAKVPTIILSISYRGVKFIDAKSKVCIYSLTKTYLHYSIITLYFYIFHISHH